MQQYLSWLKNPEVKRNRQRARQRDYEDLPFRGSMEPRGNPVGYQKELNEYLNPLVRFLRRNCGRPWDKIYSEICENMDKRGVVQAHVFQHLFDFVELNPVFEGNSVYSRGWWGLRPLYHTGWSFYVDLHGALRTPREKSPSRKTKKTRPDHILPTDNESVLFIRRQDRTWFEAQLKSLPEPDVVRPYDKILGRLIHPVWDRGVLQQLYGRAGVYGHRLRTLSKREKAAFDLK